MSSNPPSFSLSPHNQKLKASIKAKLTKLPDAVAAKLYRENCIELLDGLAKEGPVTIPPGGTDEQVETFVSTYLAQMKGQEGQLADLMQKLFARISMEEV